MLTRPQIITFISIYMFSPDIRAADSVTVTSPDKKNVIELHASETGPMVSVKRAETTLFKPARIGPTLAEMRLDEKLRIDKVDRETINESFPLYWGKTNRVRNYGATAKVTLRNSKNQRLQIELRAYNDGVAFRYRILRQAGLESFTLKDEITRFQPSGDPMAMFNTLPNYTTSHETLYQWTKLSKVPQSELTDCPFLLVWPSGTAAAITEACVFDFAGMYLQREKNSTALRCRLSPLPNRKEVCVTGETPHASPWRVILLADQAGQLTESNLLLCLNESPQQDFSWARPGKSTFHWWYGDFEDDYKLADERPVYVARHKRYIDFCAKNNIAYHALSGDGYAWFKQSRIDYGTAAADADVRVARPELGLPEILAYAKEKGVGIRLWVHWKSLDKHLEEAMETYNKWGVKGLMVDFLDRDDQQMLAYTKRMLDSAARNKIHIQIHGSSKYSGEQRTYPHLFNREGVLNLEYSKWSHSCTPAHSVNVAYTRALAGPVDFHLGGMRCVTRNDFKPRDRAPVVMGTRCHHLALYVVYENPMPMVADAPKVYEGLPAMEFIKQVPTTWDETRFVAGQPGEYFVVARRKGTTWYVAGITNWTARTIEIPMKFLGQGEFKTTKWIDGANADNDPNQISSETTVLESRSKVRVKMATGGGFVLVVAK